MTEYPQLEKWLCWREVAVRQDVGRPCFCGHDKSGHYRYNKWSEPCADWDFKNGCWVPCGCGNHRDMRISRNERLKMGSEKGTPRPRSGYSEKRKVQVNPLKGFYKTVTTTGWSRTEAIERSLDKVFLKNGKTNG